jgi:predicted small metal-binding protein
MPKIFRCADVIPGCTATMEGQNMTEVTAKAREHGETAHGRTALAADLTSFIHEAIRGTPPDPSSDQPTRVVIVRRGQEARFRILQAALLGERVRIVWDRRTADRRQDPQPVGSERRRDDRRSAPPVSWEAWDFITVETPPSRPDVTSEGA